MRLSPNGVFAYRSGALLGKLLVVVVTADAIRAVFDSQLQTGMTGDVSSHLGQFLPSAYMRIVPSLPLKVLRRFLNRRQPAQQKKVATAQTTPVRRKQPTKRSLYSISKAYASKLQRLTMRTLSG
jgi:hypothetical protein